MAVDERGPPSKHYFKGRMMKTETGDTSTIIDFDAQTLTTINNRLKTVTVRSLSDIGAAAGHNGASVQIDVKETGQQKTINGYNAKELIMTMDVDVRQARQMGKMRMEMDLWLSTDVPGIGELKSFYQKNMERFPWAALSGGSGNAANDPRSTGPDAGRYGKAPTAGVCHTGRLPEGRREVTPAAKHRLLARAAQ
jgi:hypothetical protein